MIRIVSQEEAERADFVVCVRKGTPTPFADNEEGVCAHCGTPIIFRPHIPMEPPRVCLECATAMVRETRQ